MMDSVVKEERKLYLGKLRPKNDDRATRRARRRLFSLWMALSLTALAPDLSAGPSGPLPVRDRDVIFAPEKQFTHAPLRVQQQDLGLMDPNQARTVVDVMILYTSRARAAYGESGVRRKIELSVACINEAFNRSGVNARFRLVYQGEADWHEESNLASDELNWLSEDERVAELRDEVGADLVTLLVRTGQPNGGLAFFNSPFAIYDGSPLKFAHECGHNLGCSHDRPNAGNASQDPGCNFGYSFTPPGSEFNYGDMMSYVGSQIEQFSNPDRFFMGTATGVPAGHVDATGLPDAADNVTTLNGYAPYAGGSKSIQIAVLQNATLKAPENQFEFEIAGGMAGDCVIEETTDLNQWRTLLHVPLNPDGSEITQVQDDRANVPARFYRARTDQGYALSTVGFVRRTIPTGYSLLANPLENGNNTLGLLLPSVPEGTQVYKWIEGKQTWSCSSFSLGAWDDGGGMSLHPGEGVVVRNPGAAFVVVFAGEVNGALRNRVPLDWSIRSSAIPQAGWISSTLGMVPFGAGCELFRFGSHGSYEVYFWDGQDWSPSEPWIESGEAFWCRSPVNAFVWERCVWDPPTHLPLSQE